MNLFDEYGKIRPQMIMISAKSGAGKGLSGEALTQIFNEDGKYVVIVIADPKKECEYSYAQFLPKERYHLEALRKEGRLPRIKNVKTYHPYTNALTRSKLPDYNLYTISLKSLGRKDFSMLCETQSDNDSIKLLMSATKQLGQNDGLYSLLHLIQDMVKGKKEGKTHKADSKNFLLSTSSGTAKSLQDVSNNFKVFREHYFLTKDTCKYNLNIKEIINDRDNYHVFTTKYIKDDDKVSEFTTLYILNQILKYKDEAKYPILIVIPEIRYLCPFKSEGYKKYLADGIWGALSMMRSMGRGFSCIMDTQVLTGVDEEVRNSATTTFLGEIGGASELDKVCKMLNLKSDIKNQLKKMQYQNSYFIYGQEDRDAIRLFFPTHCHCEPSYHFEEMFEKEYPERMKYYGDMIDEMKKDMKLEEDKIRDKIKKREKEERDRIEALQKNKEEKVEKKLKVEEKLEKAKEMQSKSKSELSRLIYEAKIKDPDKSWRKLGLEFGIGHITAKNKYFEYEKEKQKIDKEEESIDFEDKFLEQ